MLSSAATLGVGIALLTLTFTYISGWSIDPLCPGSETFCDGVYWTTAVEYLPVWLFTGQIMVVLALASPFSLLNLRQ